MTLKEGLALKTPSGDMIFPVKLLRGDALKELLAPTAAFTVDRLENCREKQTESVVTNWSIS